MVRGVGDADRAPHAPTPSRPVKKARSTMTTAKDEATRAPIVVPYDGTSYTIAVPITIEALEAIDDEKYVKAIRELLGREQWNAFKSTHTSTDDLEPFVTAIMESLGNWSASSSS